MIDKKRKAIGLPVFKGTRIPVRHIVELLDQGASEKELLDDYPSLTTQDIRMANSLEKQYLQEKSQ